MKMKDFVLVKPTDEYAEKIMDYRNEFINAGDSMDGCGSLRIIDNGMDFIKKCRDYENIDTLPAGRVLATQFLFIRKEDNRIVGMLQVRHYFNDYLERFGGHIGYSVRPSERRKGYAKEMLRMSLPYCRQVGIERVLVTCIEDNEGSEKTILANGGVYESTIYEPNERVNLKRFWIDV